METAFAGIELVTKIMARTRIYEILYLAGDAELMIRDTLKAELIKLYASILKFLAMSRRYLAENDLGRPRQCALYSFNTVLTNIEKTRSAVFDTGELKSQLSSVEQLALQVSGIARDADGESRFLACLTQGTILISLGNNSPMLSA